MHPRWIRPLAFGLGLGGFAVNAHAQRAPVCDPAVPVPGWLAADLGLVSAGASAPADDGFTLCGDGAGYGQSDALRTLNQDVDADFSLTTLLIDVDEGGLGGIEVRTVMRDPGAPRARLSVVRDVEGARLEADVRGVGRLALAVASTPVELPVFLRLQRQGGLLSGAWSPDGAVWFESLAFDTAATPLAATTLAVAAVQAAPEGGAPRTARFDQVDLEDFTPPPDAECVEASVGQTGAKITVRGARMAQVQSARVAGERAKIVARSEDALVLRAPRPDAVVASGAIVLEATESETLVGGRVSFAGRPFVRGDLDENGRVDAADARALSALVAGRLPFVACEAAADVDGDGDIDAEDARRLSAYLRGLARPPVAPFPAPGFAATPTLACGLGAPPVAEALFGVDGEPIPVGATLREGDVVELRGQRLPTGHEMSAYFGDVRMEQLPFSTERSLLLRVGPVPTGGEKCPRLFESSDADPAPTVRFGRLLEVRPDTRARHLCPAFEPSRGVAGGARWDAGRGELHVAVPRAAVDPTHGVQVDLLLARPALTGGPDRGAREVSVSARAADAAGSYESLLDELAKAVSRALDGGAPADGCRPCDFMAVPNPGLGELIIRPCDSGAPDPLPPPPLPQEDTLAPYVPPLFGGGATVLPKQPSCADLDPNGGGRLRGWCNFEKATRVGPGGLPSFETSIPQSALYDGPSAPMNLSAPADRPVSDKRIMFSADAWSEALGNGYFSACAQAARVAYCLGGHQDWMPAFSDHARVYKGFWRTLGKLPASANPDDLYSYQPPNGPRQYLVGLHVNTGTGQISTYWKWTTFWFPRGNDTHSKDGQPMSETYNPACSTGSYQDMPQEITGVWRNYMMCTNSENGGTPCGNPWGPTDECAETTCRDCHVEVAIDFPGITPLGELSASWLLSVTRPGPVKDCYEEIVAGINQGQQPYVNLAPDNCVD